MNSYSNTAKLPQVLLCMKSNGYNDIVCQYQNTNEMHRAD